jgi:hypothetical protein
MGYCYERGPSGRHILCCDSCGHAGGVRKRTCPFKVTTPEGHKLPYCYPSALCSECYTKHKATLHKDCEAAAARSQLEYDEEKRMLEAGESKSKVGFGSWHELVPDGMVGRGFQAKDGTMTYVLLPSELDQTRGNWLSAYPEAEPWTAMAEQNRPTTTKEVSLV